MTTVPPPARRAEPAPVLMTWELAQALKDSSAYYATHPRTPAGPEISDYPHPDRSAVCNGRSISEHAFCGGEYVTPLGDTECACPCHHQG